MPGIKMRWAAGGLGLLKLFFGIHSSRDMEIAIEQIKERLSKYTHVRYDVVGPSVSVLPTSDGGFTVRLEITQGQYTVSFNGWHERFLELDDALDCFAFGLSDKCRLKECRRGGFAYRWTVESWQNGKWAADSETGLFLFMFWKPKEVRYLQNNLMTSNDETSS